MKVIKVGKVKIGNITTCDEYKTDTGCKILVAKEGDEKIKRYHLSISHPHRNPTWEEIRDCRNALLSRDKDFCMILPRQGDYVNIHQFCFHLWEIKNGELEQAIDRL